MLYRVPKTAGGWLKKHECRRQNPFPKADSRSTTPPYRVAGFFHYDD